MTTMNSPIVLTKKSSNSKLGNIAATYAPIEQTCPSSCELKDKVCYAQSSFVGMINGRLVRNAKRKKYTALQLARIEARLIDGMSKEAELSGGKKALPMLRLHVSGDSKTVKGTKALAAAAERYMKRGGKQVYSYTHAHKKVPRKAWGKVSILASIDSIAEADEAFKAGYVPAIVVDKFDGNKAFEMKGSSIKFVPCPNQTMGTTCEECKLCMMADNLHKAGRGIAFAVHSINKNKFKLKVI